MPGQAGDRSGLFFSKSPRGFSLLFQFRAWVFFPRDGLFPVFTFRKRASFRPSFEVPLEAESRNRVEQNASKTVRETNISTNDAKSRPVPPDLRSPPNLVPRDPYFDKSDSQISDPGATRKKWKKSEKKPTCGLLWSLFSQKSRGPIKSLED